MLADEVTEVRLTPGFPFVLSISECVTSGFHQSAQFRVDITNVTFTHKKACLLKYQHVFIIQVGAAKFVFQYLRSLGQPMNPVLDQPNMQPDPKVVGGCIEGLGIQLRFTLILEDNLRI